MYIVEKDVKDAAGSLQVCAGQEAESEAAIHAIYDVYQQDETEAVLLVDADNNSINRKAMLHNISITCLIITTFIANCYMESARIFVVGNHEIKSREGRSLENQQAMGAYALGVTPLIHFLSEFIFINEHKSKELAIADDFTVAGKVSKIKAYWDILQHQGSLFGYFPKLSKLYLVVKEQYYNKAVDILMGSKVKVTSERKRHLGTVIDSEAFKVSYTKSVGDNWIKQLLPKVTAHNSGIRTTICILSFWWWF